MTTFAGDASSVPAARRFAAQAVADAGGHGAILEKTQLLVTEVTTNAVHHARSPIRVTVRPSADRVRIEVRDDDPTALQPPLRPDPDAENGRGLWLVSLLARSWGVNRNARGKTVWFEVD